MSCTCLKMHSLIGLNMCIYSWPLSLQPGNIKMAMYLELLNCMWPKVFIDAKVTMTFNYFIFCHNGTEGINKE